MSANSLEIKHGEPQGENELANRLLERLKPCFRAAFMKDVKATNEPFHQGFDDEFFGALGSFKDHLTQTCQGFAKFLEDRNELDSYNTEKQYDERTVVVDDWFKEFHIMETLEALWHSEWRGQYCSAIRDPNFLAGEECIAPLSALVGVNTKVYQTAGGETEGQTISPDFLMDIFKHTYPFPPYFFSQDDTVTEDKLYQLRANDICDGNNPVFGFSIDSLEVLQAKLSQCDPLDDADKKKIEDTFQAHFTPHPEIVLSHNQAPHYDLLEPIPATAYTPDELGEVNFQRLLMATDLPWQGEKLEDGKEIPLISAEYFNSLNASLKL